MSPRDLTASMDNLPMPQDLLDTQDLVDHHNMVDPRIVHRFMVDRHLSSLQEAQLVKLDPVHLVEGQELQHHSKNYLVNWTNFVQ